MKAKEIESRLNELKQEYEMTKKEFIVQLCKDLNINKLKIDYAEEYDDNNYYNRYFLSKINDIELEQEDDFDLYSFESYSANSHIDLPDKLKSFLIISNLKEEDFFYFGKSVLSLEEEKLLNLSGTEITIESLGDYF